HLPLDFPCIASMHGAASPALLSLREASAMTADAVATDEEIPMSKKKSTAKTKTSVGKGRRKAGPAKKAATAGLCSNSKLTHLLQMVSQPEGSTSAAIMKPTGWQQQSVGGVFAGVVHKKLKLRLVPEQADGERWYRIIADKGSKPTTGDAEHPAA